MISLHVAKGLRVRRSEHTGVTRVDLDPAIKRQLQEAANIGGDICSFWACPGPETNRIKNYYTCRNCAAIIQIRRALKKLGIDTEG